jgi:hypothetical protein
MLVTDYAMLFPEIIDELKLLKLKHVRPQIILSRHQEKSKDISTIQEIGNLKFMGVPPTNMIIGDDQNVLIVAAGDYVKNMSEDMVGVSMSHASTGFISKLIFKNLWDNL